MAATTYGTRTLIRTSRVAWVAALVGGLALGCAGLRGGDASLRVTELAEHGDPTRRASTRLVGQGLRDDAARRSAQALGHYERAVQVDPTNPIAYLAISRHHIERYDVPRGLEALDQAEGLFGDGAEEAWGAEAHIAGLRGAAYARSGREREARPLLARARELAPGVWSDEWLTADELL